MSIRLIVLLIINIVNIYFVKIFTIDTDVFSGNGNLGILFVLLGYILIIFFALELRRTIKDQYQISNRKNIIILFVSILILAVSALLEYSFAVNLIEQLGGFGNPESAIYRLNFLNQYTNTIFLNVYILLILISLLMILFSIEKLINKDKIN